VVYQIELANSHLMPSLLEIAVAFVEMSDSPFGFERVQPKQTKLIPGGTLSSAVVFIGCHKNPTFFMFEK
jgi:hypothetical protein